MAPLQGIRVADFTESLAGPFCSQILADLGADVVKVERPGGDPARGWGPPFWNGESTMFLSANRGKRSIVLDLRRPGGRGAAKRLIARADVVLQSFRGGVAEALGLGFSDVQRLNPAAVYCDITAWGHRGPRRGQPGYDPILQAYAGLMSVTGAPDGPPARLGVSAVDMGTGMWAALGVLAALLERREGGAGGRVVTSLLETALVWGSYHLTGFLATGAAPRAHGSGLPMIAPYGAFPASDGWIMIGAATDSLFARSCAALGVPTLADDPRFRDNAARVEHRAVLDAIIGDCTRARSADELLERLEGVGVPCAPIHDMRAVAVDPQVGSTGALRRIPHPRIADYRDVGLPLERDGRRWGSARVPPLAGEHTMAVLRELGYDQADADAIVREAAGAGRSAPPSPGPLERRGLDAGRDLRDDPLLDVDRADEQA